MTKKKKAVAAVSNNATRIAFVSFASGAAVAIWGMFFYLRWLG